MLANRRSSERRVCKSFAKIQFATGGLPRDCMITDMSDGGVKIIAEYPEIPSEFTVIFSERPAAPMQAGLADRLRIRRPVPRLEQIGTAPFADRRDGGRLLEGKVPAKGLLLPQKRASLT